MKKIFTIIATLLFTSSVLQAQEILAGWSFPSGTPIDSIADQGIAANLDKAISTQGGTSAIDFTKNGFTTKCAQVTGWDNGALLKAWTVKVTTANYQNLKLSSKMQSGGNNPGPRDFRVQYRLNEINDWVELAGSEIITANDWTTGVLDSIALPAECNNQQVVYIRWLMTTNTNSNGEAVAANGINKIDDIYISGKAIPTSIAENQVVPNLSIYPNPSNGSFTITSNENIVSMTMFSTKGECVYQLGSLQSKVITPELYDLTKGIYFVKVITLSGKMSTSKVCIN
jgi:hypothetical protein